MKKLTSYLKSKFQNYSQDELNDAFVKVCKNGHLEVVKYLTTSCELKIHIEKQDLNIGFIRACEKGHLEVVRYLLTSTELKENADIHENDDLGIKIACFYGHLDIIQYLLTSLELKEHADIQKDNYYSLSWAYMTKRIDVFSCLLPLCDCAYKNFEAQGVTLEFAMVNKHHTLTKALMMCFYRHDRIQYLNNILEVEKYCIEHSLNFEEWQEEMVKNDVDINSHTTELFL